MNQLDKKNILNEEEEQNLEKYYEGIINYIVKDNDSNKKENYLAQVTNQYLIHKNENTPGKEKYSSSISFFFFKFLNLVENPSLRNKILEILYKSNSQKKIFYENLSNIVILVNKSDYKKLMKLKDLFINLFNTVHSISLVKRLDKNSFALFEELRIQFDDLINLLLDEKKWRNQNNIFNVYGNNGEDKESGIDLRRNKSIFNLDIESNNNKTGISQYFLSEFSHEKVIVMQATLYNLGFIDLINQIFEYISWVSNIRDDFSDELSSLEKILISIYKLLVVFIFDNKKHQYLIKEKLNLYLCPLKLQNSPNTLSFIGYFLLNVVYFFETEDDFNQIRNLNSVMDSLSLLQYLEWEKNKKIIPFFVQSFKIIISFCNYDYFILLYPVLERINNVLVKEILRNTDTSDDLMFLIKILELITIVQDKKCSENKNTSILTLHEIINVFLNMINLLSQDQVKKYMKLSRIFITVTNLLYNNFELYKNDFLINISYAKNLSKTLIIFTNNFELTDDLIYCKRNKIEHLRNFNEFIGISIPKLYIILTSLQMNKYYESDSFRQIINLSNELYYKIYNVLEKDKTEKIFLTKKNQSEIDDILKNIAIDLICLSYVKKKMIKNSTKLSMPRVNKSLVKKNDLINRLYAKDEYNPQNLSSIWNKIKTKINYNNGLIHFQNVAKNEINKERMAYVEYLNNFFKEIQNSNTVHNKNDIDSTVVFFNYYIDILKEYYSKDYISYKNEIFFFYWTNIHLMRFNRNKHCFIDNDNTLFDASNLTYYDLDNLDNINKNEKENNGNNTINNYEDKKTESSIKTITSDEKLGKDKKPINYFKYSLTPYNKIYFHDLDFIKLTIRQFNSVNVYSNDYEHILYIKFLNSYLDQLDEENMAKFLEFFIEQPEAENIFCILNNILDALNKDIIKTLSKEKEDDDKDKEEKLKYSSNLFENDIDKYELIIQFITQLSSNNGFIKCKMKDYLRDQYNNTKSFNFIVILSNILDNFIAEPSNLCYINSYYSLIIQIIDCICRCCNGPSKENQDCVVEKTNLLDFGRYVLKRITYRKKIKANDTGLDLVPCYDRSFADEVIESVEGEDNGDNSYEEYNDNVILVDDCLTIGLDRQKLSILKYKLIVMISILSVGRKKDDYIYELIHKKIDFDVLTNLMIETYKEILIEKDSQQHHENLIFDEDMLLRMDKNLLHEKDEEINENFIIFEIGTFAFIIINIELQCLIRPYDFKICNVIYSINKELREKTYHGKKTSVFYIVKSFFNSIYNCFRELCIKCGNCLNENIHEDFYLENSFNCAYSFYFDHTRHVEIINYGVLIKYYVKLSPICKCLTEEMKEEFYSKIDGFSTSAKIEALFKNVDFYHYQFVHAKRRLDLFRKMPILDLLFNHYKLYEYVFMIVGALLNVLLFASFYRTNDDYGVVEEYSEDFKFDYGFLYKSKNIVITRNIFFYTTLVQCIFAVLILLTYLLNKLPYYLYYEIPDSERNKFFSNENEDQILTYYKTNYEETFSLDNYDRMRQNVKLVSKVFSFISNLFRDTKLFYHLLLLADCLTAMVTQNYRFLSFLLVEIIMHSDTLIYIVKSFWLPRKYIIITLILFYLIAYYFIIFVYLYIPNQLPTKDCLKFSDCYFTLCNQIIKNSNGIINYLNLEGLYIYDTLYQNPRFWIDNFLAIIDLMLVMQIVCGIIINSYLTQRKEHNKFEKNKNNVCFICGLGKNELIKYYSHEQGFDEHIKLDHYLWNYMFLIFNVTKKNPKNLISMDRNILDCYKNNNYTKLIPFKKCLKQMEIGGDLEEEKVEEEESENEDS